MKLLKWLSVTDRFYKIYLDKQLAPFGINNSQYMFLIKICRSPGILQDSLMDMFYVHPSNIVRTVLTKTVTVLIHPTSPWQPPSHWAVWTGRPR